MTCLRRLLVGVALAAVATPACAEWAKVATSSDGSVFYMDANRITKVGDRVHAWVKIDHSKNRGVSYRSEMQLSSYICSTRKARLIQFSEYDSYGKVVRSDSVSDSKYSDAGYEHVTPETVREALLDTACLFK